MDFKSLKNYINKIGVFYFPSTANYWHSITPVNNNNNKNCYYLDFSSKYNYPGLFDDKGIPLYPDANGKPFYHPVVIAQYALGVYEIYLKKGAEDDRKKFIILANWMINNGVSCNNGFVWLIKEGKKEFKINENWISAMVQGECMSVLCRAYSLTGKDEYIKKAELALIPFFKDVAEGGLVNYFDGHPVFEECPAPDKVNSVLNGFIFSLYGLLDVYKTTGNKKAEERFNTGVNTLEKIIHYYDTGLWTRYFLYDYPGEYVSSYTYHLIVINQLKSLYILTGKEVFNEYAKRWTKQSKSLIKKSKALVKKLTYAHTIFH